MNRTGKAGIFLENNFEYQNAHYNEFGGAISANYRGCFSISCLLFDIFSAGMAPWYLVKWAISNSRGLIPHPAGLGISLGKDLVFIVFIFLLGRFISFSIFAMLIG